MASTEAWAGAMLSAAGTGGAGAAVETVLALAVVAAGVADVTSDAGLRSGAATPASTRQPATIAFVCHARGAITGASAAGSAALSGA